MNTSESDKSSHGALWAGLVLFVPLLALWWQVGESGFDRGRADRGSDQVVQTARGINFHVPSGWRKLTSSMPLRQLGFTLLWAYAPAGESARGEVAIGLGDGTGPALLSGGTLAALHSPTAATIEELRSNAFVRVDGTLVGQRSREAVVVYSQPATPRNVEIMCVAAAGSRTDSPETNACRAVAGTLELSSKYGSVITLNQLASNPARVHKALAECYGRAKQLREALLHAAGREEQVQQASQLETLYKSAADHLARVDGDPIAAPAQDALRKVLQRVASGYALLRHGATGATGRWVDARFWRANYR